MCTIYDAFFCRKICSLTFFVVKFLKLRGGMFPPQTSFWGRWAPMNERTFLLGMSNSIAILGNLISNSLTAVICEYIGWPWAFYIYGTIGILITAGEDVDGPKNNSNPRIYNMILFFKMIRNQKMFRSITGFGF